jgi:hypothetical protein
MRWRLRRHRNQGVEEATFVNGVDGVTFLESLSTGAV